MGKLGRTARTALKNTDVTQPFEQKRIPFYPSMFLSVNRSTQTGGGFNLLAAEQKGGKGEGSPWEMV